MIAADRRASGGRRLVLREQGAFPNAALDHQEWHGEPALNLRQDQGSGEEEGGTMLSDAEAVGDRVLRAQRQNRDRRVELAPAEDRTEDATESSRTTADDERRAGERRRRSGERFRNRDARRLDLIGVGLFALQE